MSTPENPESDPLDALVGASASLPEDDRLRRSVLARTTGVIRRRRRIRRFSITVALAGCYLAGAATVQLWRAGAPTPDRSVARDEKVPADDERQTPLIDRTEQPGGQTVASAASPYEVYRRVSDRCLTQQGDLSLALRYYCRALETASPEERAISAEDSWLLMALKDLDTKENRDENNDG